MTQSTDKDAFSAFCRDSVGLDAKEVADIANVPRRTFYDWWRTRRTAVELIVEGIKYRLITEEIRLTMVALRGCL